MAVSQETGDHRLASAKLHPRKKTASFTHADARWIECVFDTNRINNNPNLQVMAVECATKRGTDIDGPLLERELKKAQVGGDVKIDDGLVLLQYQWGYGRDETHSFILRDYSRCIDCGRCAQVCKDIVGAGCYDFIGKGFDSLVTTADYVSLNETPCVSCGRCAETCPVGALMPRPRILETYQLDVSRCIFCGICADACPYDALRCGPEFEFSEYQRDLPMLDILEMSDRERPTR